MFFRISRIWESYNAIFWETNNEPSILYIDDLIIEKKVKELTDTVSYFPLMLDTEEQQ